MTAKLQVVKEWPGECEATYVSHNLHQKNNEYRTRELVQQDRILYHMQSTQGQVPGTMYDALISVDQG